LENVFRYEQIQPPAELARFVKFFWIFEGNFNAIARYVQITSASVFPKLAVQYKGAFYQTFVSGPSASAIPCGILGPTNISGRLFADQPVGVIGACFYPHTLAQLWRIPTIEFYNRAVHLFDLSIPFLAELVMRICEAEHNADRISILQHYLVKSLARNYDRNDPSANYIHLAIRKQGELSMQELAGYSHVSQRQFERTFKQHAGLSPLAFSRMLRFEKSIECFYSGSVRNFTELAYAAGYYDQAHFNRDFKRFSGVSPKNYFAKDVAYFFR